MKRSEFYINIKSQGLFESLDQAQVDGIEAILIECEAQNITDPRQVAYILGTVYHETGLKVQGVLKRTMAPVEEAGKGHNRTYGHRVWYSGKVYADVPFIYYGRGFTQNTWRDIYRSLALAAKRAGKDWDFEYHPGLLLEVRPSAWASVFAMRTGLYTGVSLARYFNDTMTDWVNARRIVNVLDCAEMIAGYALKFYLSINLST